MKLTSKIVPALMLGILLGITTQASAEPRAVPTPVRDFSNNNIDIIFSPNDTVLTATDRANIRNSHFLALQQVQVALEYLQVYGNQIINGQNEFYNNTFGNFYKTDATNTLLGQYDLTTTGVLLGRTIGTASRVNNTTVSFPTGTVFDPSFLFVGQEVFIDQERYTVVRINNTVPVNNPNNQNPTPPTIQSIILDRPYTGFNPLPIVQKIEGETQLPNTAHYDRVVQIFSEIEFLLDFDTQYFGDMDLAASQAIYDAVFAPNRSPINPDVDPSQGFLFDRRTRQFGLSNSDSEAHLAQLLNDPDNPLLWTDDNLALLDANGDPLPDHRKFFFDKLTAITDTLVTRNADGTITYSGNSVLVGGAFTSELETAGNLFDGSVQTDKQQTPLAQYQQIIAAFAEIALLSHPDFFASDSSNNTPFSGAFGVNELLDLFGIPQGTADNPHPQNTDANNFALFADIFTDPTLGTGIGDGTTLPPVGKNLQAVEPGSFIPAIPLN